ncbi:MAG: amino acid adenylation domain-containing protein [Solobacterium sp.]|nr:amino acid adenylation domain-containing protein [Solobacterium sp.]
MILNVLEMLEKTASRCPERLAFSDPERNITYKETLEQSKKIGSFLTEKGFVKVPVSFYLEKSTYAVCGMFGAVYAGGFYSLIDLRQPENRIRSILDTLKPAVILSDEENYDAACSLSDLPVYKIEEILETADINEEALAAVRAKARDVDPLYVNFTSGSTGVPKGVTVCHRSVIDFIVPFTEIFGITENDIMGNQAPFDFDVSVKDIYSALYTGARVALIPRSYFSNPTKLMDYLCDSKVTVLVWAVSAMCFVSIMNGFGYRNPETLRIVMFSGEVMPIKQFNVWKKYQPHVKFVNLYGPTEITCNCTYYELEDRMYEPDEKIPVGKAFPNEKVFLLDDENKEVTEPGIPGELCVSGSCLALGYYGNRQKTGEVFVQNPLNPDWNEMIYRTGDLCAYQEDGNLVYISRKDFQIKHLGHRIELGEIESGAQQVEGIERACCLYDAVKKKIVLFYTGSKDKKELLEEMKELLPVFMIPNKAIQLEEMPLNKNGKIDRNALKETGGIR